MGMGTGVRDGSARLVDPDTVLPSIEEEEETAANHNPPANEWSPEDDRRLVQLVLDKFSLSRREWDSCARRLGRDGASVGRRWRHLVGDGNVGLRPDERV